MRLTKHHGLGNDFLVLLDAEGLRPLGPDDAVAACDRTTGIGADGLIRATRGSTTDLVMMLLNADGSRAEMSGNGVSCMVQAALIAGLVEGPTVSVATEAGVKHVDVLGREAAGRHRVRVDMGRVTVGTEAPEWLDDFVLRAVTVDAGNPHLVLQVADVDERPDLVRLGLDANRSTPGGVNVELVAAGPGDGDLQMWVYERGVGLTEACGTGACAAAAAAHRWELVGPTVEVHQPGGPVTVELGDPTHLSVTVEAIASADWPWP